MSKKNSVGLPRYPETPEAQVTQPLALDEFPRQARIERSMNVIRQHHARIANAIELFWGHPECDEFMQKLIFNSGEEFVRARAGFKSDVLEAIINLAALHELK